MDYQAIALFAQEYPPDYPEPISVANALANGLTVREIPVRMRPREHGSSSIAGLKVVVYMLRVVGYIVGTFLRRVI